MNQKFLTLLFCTGAFLLFAASPSFSQNQTPAVQIGAFESQGDIGSVVPPGFAEYDSATRTYEIASSGQNIWALHDDFHYVWKRVSGDFAISADISFADKGGSEHKKAVLMFRQSLDPDSKYADYAVHGKGLTSLQYRHEKGAVTGEIQLTVSAPKRVRLEKRGNYVYVYIANDGEEFHPSGAAVRVSFDGPFYAGIGVSAHDANRVEKATFSNVVLAPVPDVNVQTQLYSALDVIDVASMDISEVYVAPGRIEAPNWTHDGSAFIVNGEGRIWRVPVAGGKLEVLNTGTAIQNINDHGLSPDGTQLAITDQSAADHHYRIYVLPLGGGTPRPVTEPSSYWHGWSPDGKALSFVGLRNGDYDVYTVPAAGGAETRLTTAKGIDDGPDYSPDGRYIYFSSGRNGSMQIWRMNTDGSNQQQITNDGFQSRFPHVSPDGQWLEFLTYDPNVNGHPVDKDVAIRLMSLKDGSIRVITRLFGGEGSINMPSWSPDSKKLAFVNYAYFPVDAGK